MAVPIAVDVPEEVGFTALAGSMRGVMLGGVPDMGEAGIERGMGIGMRVVGDRGPTAWMIWVPSGEVVVVIAEPPPKDAVVAAIEAAVPGRSGIVDGTGGATIVSAGGFGGGIKSAGSLFRASGVMMGTTVDERVFLTCAGRT